MLKPGDEHVSTFSDGMQCVKVKRGDGVVSVEHSKTPGTGIVFTEGEWGAFIQGAHAGEFDLT